MPDIISRSEAKVAGLKHYFTNTPCKHGHLSKRRIDNNCCVECCRLSSKLYNQKNQESISKYQIQYRSTHKEEAAEYNRHYQRDNREQLDLYWANYRKRNKEYLNNYWRNRHHSNSAYKNWYVRYRKQYYLTNRTIILSKAKYYRIHNPDKVAANTSQRRSSKNRAVPLWFEKELVDNIYTKAQELSNTLNCNIQVDHIIPLNSPTVCGLHCWTNLQLLEQSLNGSKGNNYQSDW